MNKSLGQYFTPDYVADFMCGLATCPKDGNILEPSCGEGIFLKCLSRRGFSDIVGCEIDSSLRKLDDRIINVDFIDHDRDIKYDLVIGNPPYVRWKNITETTKAKLRHDKLWQQYCNSLCDLLYFFIIKSVELLKGGGELIFITPSYWLRTTHAQKIRNYLVANGCFTHILHLEETRVFEHVSSSIMIFRYVKGMNSPEISLGRVDKKIVTLDDLEAACNDTVKISNFEIDKTWLLLDTASQETCRLIESQCRFRLGDIATIGNGMVSGLDKAFVIPDDVILNDCERQSVLNVVKAKSISRFSHQGVTRYIFIQDNLTEKEFESQYPNFHKLLSCHRYLLEKRYSYDRPIPYWSWVFPRNYNLFSKPISKILVPCKERITNKKTLRFAKAKAGEYPTQDVTGIVLHEKYIDRIDDVLEWLNSPEVFYWVKNNGIIKGGVVEFSEKPLSSIPVNI